MSCEERAQQISKRHQHILSSSDNSNKNTDDGHWKLENSLDGAIGHHREPSSVPAPHQTHAHQVDMNNNNSCSRNNKIAARGAEQNNGEEDGKEDLVSDQCNTRGTKRMEKQEQEHLNERYLHSYNDHDHHLNQNHQPSAGDELQIHRAGYIESSIQHKISREIDSNLAHIDIDSFDFKQLAEPLQRLISLDGDDFVYDSEHSISEDHSNALILGSIKHLDSIESARRGKSTDQSKDQRIEANGHPLILKQESDTYQNLSLESQEENNNDDASNKLCAGQQDFNTLSNDNVLSDQCPELLYRSQNNAITDDNNSNNNNTNGIVNYESVISSQLYTIAFHDSISSGASSDLSQTLNESASHCELVDTSSFSREEPITVRSQQTDSAINSSITQDDKSNTSKNRNQRLNRQQSTRPREISNVEQLEENPIERKDTSSTSEFNNNDRQQNGHMCNRLHLLCKEINNNGNLNHIVEGTQRRESECSNKLAKDIYVFYPNYSLPDLSFLKLRKNSAVLSFRNKNPRTNIFPNKDPANVAIRHQQAAPERAKVLELTHGPSKNQQQKFVPEEQQSPSSKLKDLLDRYDSSEFLRFLLPQQVRSLIDKIKYQLKLRKKEIFNDPASQSYLNKLDDLIKSIEVEKQERAKVVSGRRYNKFSTMIKQKECQNDCILSKKGKTDTIFTQEKRVEPDFTCLNYLRAKSILPDNIYKILLLSSPTKKEKNKRDQLRKSTRSTLTKRQKENRTEDIDFPVLDETLDELSKNFILPKTVIQVLRILWGYEEKKQIPSSQKINDSRSKNHAIVKPILDKSSKLSTMGDVTKKSESVRTKAVGPASKKVLSAKDPGDNIFVYPIHPTYTRKTRSSIKTLSSNIETRNLPTSHCKTVDQLSIKKIGGPPCVKSRKSLPDACVKVILPSGGYSNTVRSKTRPTRMNYFDNTCRKSYIPVRIRC